MRFPGAKWPFKTKMANSGDTIRSSEFSMMSPDLSEKTDKDILSIVREGIAL